LKEDSTREKCGQDRGKDVDRMEKDDLGKRNNVFKDRKQEVA
jgi:hypothetical protein